MRFCSFEVTSYRVFIYISVEPRIVCGKISNECKRKECRFLLVRTHLWLSGRVQGVAFRYYATIKAKEFGVAGYIKNLGDGRVEVVIQGESESVKRMISWCSKGPPHAIVENVILIYEDPDPGCVTFQVEG